jgi:hypothetical protein
VVEHDDGKTITVGLEEVVGQPTERPPKFVPDPVVAGPGGCRCPLCVIPIPVSYRDVLILEQFMRPDGTVLPPDFTGCFLCIKMVQSSDLILWLKNEEKGEKISKDRKFNSKWLFLIWKRRKIVS